MGIIEESVVVDEMMKGKKEGVRLLLSSLLHKKIRNKSSGKTTRECAMDERRLALRCSSCQNKKKVRPKIFHKSFHQLTETSGVRSKMAENMRA